MEAPELTHTADDGAARARPPAPERIGRYTIERVLGAGGMGVVYAARDPDLERRVAIKVLRGGARVGSEGRARLLREARAMAKLAHPNVIVVHEVGTDAGVDFVAMELIDGASAAEWLAAGPRPRTDVLRVFRAAGEGLAAAHAGGLVHRDFKPHNVLLGNGGRVVVTDFGLARAAHERGGGAARDPAPRPLTGLEETVSPDDSGATAPAVFGALTGTGAVVGTPAYMPPEQHAGAAPDPRGDQFAFCVALWEALAGERPFRGGSLDELRAAVGAGLPVGAGAALPRAIRAVLARGLAADPVRRWPSMNDLLAALTAAESRPRRLATAGMLGAVAAAAAITAALWPAPAAPPCALPADFAAPATPGLERARTAWREARNAACATPAAVDHAARVACLRAAADRIAALVAAVAETPAAIVHGADVPGLAPEPEVCAVAIPPGTPTAAADAAAEAASRRATAAFALAMRADQLADLRARADRVVAGARASGSCAALAEALVEAASAVTAVGDTDAARERAEAAAAEAARCGDDATAARAAVALLAVARGQRLPAAQLAALRDRAGAAVDRAGRPLSLTAELAASEAIWTLTGVERDQSIATLDRLQAALAGAGRDLDAARLAVASAGLRELRAGPDDDAEVERRLQYALDVAATDGDDRRAASLRARLAFRRWTDGDAAGFAALRAQTIAYWSSPAGRLAAAALGIRPPSGVTLAGRVVDSDGRPVAGADVYAAPMLAADRDRLGVFDFGSGYLATAHAVTDGDGRFRLDAEPSSAIAAASADGSLRSLAEAARPEQTLRLVRPGRITGRVVFKSPRPRSVLVEARRLLPASANYQHYAPVAADGSFVLDRIPPGSYDVRVGDEAVGGGHVTGRRVEVRGDVGPVELTWTRGGASLEVRIRGSRGVIEIAEVFVFAGAFDARNGAELQHALGETTDLRTTFADVTDAAAARRAREHGVDLSVRVEGVEPGPYTACVVPMSGPLHDRAFADRLARRFAQLDVTCVRTHVVAPASDVTIETEPMKRLSP